jgi:hypothetical protein
VGHLAAQLIHETPSDQRAVTGARLALDAEERNGAYPGIELIEKLAAFKSGEMPLAVRVGKRLTERFSVALPDSAQLVGLALEVPHVLIRCKRLEVQILNACGPKQRLQARGIGECVCRASHPSALANVDHGTDATALQRVQEGGFGEAIHSDRLNAQHNEPL